MFIKKIDVSASGHTQLWMVFGFWLVIGWLPDGDLAFATSKPQSLFGNIHRWADWVWAGKLKKWANTQDSLELGVMVQRLQDRMSFIEHAVASREMTQLIGRCANRELGETLAAIETVLREREHHAMVVA